MSCVTIQNIPGTECIGNSLVKINGNFEALSTGLCELSANSAGAVQSASNLGSSSNGEGLYSTKVGSDLRFKRIKAGSNITLTSEANDVVISADAGVTKLVAGSNITLSPAGGTGQVTINAASGATGTVTNVTGTAPITVTNGSTTPAISITAATTSAAGSMSSTDKTRLNDASSVNGLVKCNGSGNFSAAGYVDGISPVGSVMAFPSTTAPTGWIKLNGASLSRSTYSDLWSFAQASGNLVTEAAWSSATGSFSQGNGSTTFRLPDLRGEFVRVWDDSRGIDSGRIVGENQQATGILSFPTSSSSGIVFTDNDGSISGPNSVRFSLTSTTGSDSYKLFRPRNVALLYCIKY